MRRQFAHSVFVAAALMSAAGISRTHALGLDEIEVSSSLNQRLLASIALTEVTADDLETVSVTVAPNEAFERAGIERAEYLTSLDFQVKNDRGQPRIVISSDQIAREPVLSLLVQARWRGGKILRDYTILLDPVAIVAAPAEMAPPPAAVAAVKAAEASPPIPVAVPAENPKTRSTQIIAAEVGFYQPPEESNRPSGQKPGRTTMKASSSDSAFDSATGSYGPVLAGETLWSIATKVRPSSKLSMDQVLLALSEANPQAIQHGTTVNKGATLRVPSAERMQAVPAGLATKRLTELRAGVPPAAGPTATATKTQATQAVVKEPVQALPAKPQPESPSALPAAPAATKPAAVTPTAAATPTVAAPAVALAAEAAPAKPDAPAATTTPAPAPEAAPAPPEPVAATAQPAVPAVTSLDQRLPDVALDGNPLAEFYQPIALIAVVLLAAVALLLARHRRKRVAVAPHFTDLAAAHGVSSTVAAAADPFADTARFGSTQTLSLAAAQDATQQIAQQPNRQQSTQKMAVQNSDFGATLVLEPQMMAALKSSTQSSAVDSKHADFDRTMQVDVDTLHIDLNDNDPLAEADFHLAYGLYDEAILLLQTAVAQNPARQELQAKLAETYFAAGRAIEFQEIAETLQDKLAPVEWSKIAIMGAQICPDADLFKSAATDGLVPDTDFNLAFDEPETPPAVPEPKAAAVIDFDIDSALTPAPELAVPDTRSSEKSLDFMLSEISSPASVVDSTALDKNIIEFDLDSPALDIDIPELSAPQIDAPGKPLPTVATDSLGFDLDELELSLNASEAGGDASDNDFNTKLDLARAYVEMGDNDMARSLLQEVQQQGSDRQQQEAAALLQRLPV